MRKFKYGDWVTTVSKYPLRGYKTLQVLFFSSFEHKYKLNIVGYESKICSTYVSSRQLRRATPEEIKKAKELFLASLV